jgi:peptide/nickel transport system ATP-binding protein
MMTAATLSPDPLLRIRNLRVSFGRGRGRIDAVRGVEFDVHRGEILGIVGESGSGKSTLAYAIMGYLGRSGWIGEGEILFRDEDLRYASPKRLRALRGNQIAMVYQDPQTSLTPSIQIGEQIAEVLNVHLGLRGAACTERVIDLLTMVNLPDPERLIQRYPHQLSGGQKQRVLIAVALACDPDLLIMDEPTTGLDVTTEARILDLVNDLKQRVNAAIIYISHNLGVIARVCDRVAVMYAGELVETATVPQLFATPRHPYTLGLLGSVPRLGTSKSDASLRSIPGRIPSPVNPPSGCVFSPRCPYARDRCREQRPDLFETADEHRSRCFFWQEVDKDASRYEDTEGIPEVAATTGPESRPLVEVIDLTKYYEGGGRSVFGGQRHVVKAVDGVDFTAEVGKTLALVGESGCGKTTLSRVIAGLTGPTSGEVRFDGQRLAVSAERRPRRIRRQLQMVFQSPESSLNPRHTIGSALDRPLKLMTGLNKDDRRARVAELLSLVNLDARYANLYPRQLSGGEKQRVCIARAFAAAPELVICDEPVSALDVSVQAAILNLFTRLQRQMGTSYLFVAHDLAVVRYLADRIAVIYLGHIVEIGTAEEIFAPPYHPYTEALLSAIPVPDPGVSQAMIRLTGPVPSPASPPSGCPFHTRCPRKIGSICEQQVPPVQETVSGHRLWCHIPLAELRAVPPIIQSPADESTPSTHGAAN